jgi:MscS family membrane protein
VVNFLAGLSIGGFALAFGAQDTIKNFLGSLMIFADKSFSVGDWIDNGNVSGTVEEIGLRSTKIRTFYNSLVPVPNSLLSDKSIDNLGKRKYRRYKTKVILKYDTPMDKVEEFIERIKQVIEEHPDTRKDYYMVYMNEFGSYGLEVLLYLFFKVPTWNLELKARHEIIAKVLEIQRELGIELAIPLVSKADL